LSARLEHNLLRVIFIMEPKAPHQLTAGVEDKLAAIGVPVDLPRRAVYNFAFDQSHHGMPLCRSCP
jgi:hypothetical protein